MKSHLSVGIYTVLQTTLQISILVITTRLLSPTDVGYYALAMLLSSMGRLGLSGVLPSIIKEADNSHPKQLQASFFVVNCIGIFFIVAIGAWIFFSNHSAENFFCALYSVAIFLAQSRSLVFEAAILKKQGNSFLIKNDFWCVLLWVMPASCLMAFYEYGLHALLFPQVIYSVARLVILRKKARLKPIAQYDRVAIMNIISLNGAGIINFMATQIDKIFITAFFPVEALGVYSRGSQSIQYIASVYSKVVGYISFPKFANEESIEKKHMDYTNSFETTVLITFIIGMFLWLPLYYFLLLVFGDAWDKTALVASILFICLGPRLSYKLSDYFLMATSRSRVVVLFQFFYLALSISFISLVYFSSRGIEVIPLAVGGAVSLYSLVLSSYCLLKAKASKKAFALLWVVTLITMLVTLVSYQSMVNAFLIGVVSGIFLLIFLGRSLKIAKVS